MLGFIKSLGFRRSGVQGLGFSGLEFRSVGFRVAMRKMYELQFEWERKMLRLASHFRH